MTPCLRLALILASLPLLAGRPALADAERAALINGVQEIAVPGLPGALCVFGDKAFAVVTDGAKSPAIVVAAGELGAGRVVAFGHEGYFDAGALRTVDTAKLLANAIAWSTAHSPPRRGNGQRVVGLRRCPSAEAVLRDLNVATKLLDNVELATSLNAVDAIMCPAGEIKDKDLIPLDAFVRRGGAVIAGLPGWGFLQTHPGASLATDLPANKLFAKAGIVWADGTADAGATHRFPVKADVSPLTNATAALAAVVGDAEGKAKLSPADAAFANAALTRAAQSLPPDDGLLLPELKKITAAHLNEAVATDKTDLLKSNALGRVALTFELNRERSLPPVQLKANPLAEMFPGLPPAGAPRVTRGVEVDMSIPDWHSTGLYAAPGEVVTVAVPGGVSGLKLRIGSHSDRLWALPTWQRAPEIDRVWPLTAGDNKVASAFGGLIYVVVPRGQNGAVSVKVANAIESPLFVLGKTDPQAWRQTIRNAPGQWAELGTRKVFLTVPSQYVRTLDDPTALMRWWDQVADGAADLFQIPRDRPRPERYVADVQISAGYMHSGYPIMTHLDAAPRMVDLATLGTKGDWGLFHELGHNHQKPEWTFPGTTEVTNNLLPLYLLETLCHDAPVHNAFTPAARAKAERKYLDGGANFATWQAEPFTALIMYQQVREGFGWDVYKKVFAEYRDLPPDRRPKSELDKHDQWMVRLSRACGHNLGPFFQHWNVPASETARQSIADLPAWSPPAAR